MRYLQPQVRQYHHHPGQHTAGLDVHRSRVYWRRLHGHFEGVFDFRGLFSAFRTTYLPERKIHV